MGDVVMQSTDPEAPGYYPAPGGASGGGVPMWNENPVNPDATAPAPGNYANPGALLPGPPPENPLSKGMVGPHPGWAEETEGNDQQYKGVADELEARRRLLNAQVGGGGNNLAVQPEGEKWANAGGKRGRDWFEQGLVEGPERLAAAVGDSEKAQAARAGELAGLYKGEAERSAQSAAAMQLRQAQDEQVIQQRQRNLDAATDRFTSDLVDQGKFWTNPGNIVAAIAYSLMPMMGGDPTSGVKLINEAINRDMAARQHAADTTLGALRSNLDGYRKIAGDRQAGDLLAEAKAKEVAANQVQAIMQKYESPISKARGEAIVQDLMNKSYMSRMQAYNMYKIHQDAQLKDKRLIDAQGTGFDGAFESWKGLPAGAKPSVGASVQGSIAGTPSVANNLGPTLKGQAAQVVNGTGKTALKAYYDGKLPGGKDLYQIAAANIALEAAAKHPNGGPAFEAEKQATMKAAEEGKVRIATAMDHEGFTGRMTVLRRLQHNMNAIEATEPNPEQFLNGTLRAVAPDAFNRWYERQVDIWSDPSTPTAEKKRAKEAAEAARTLRVQIGMAQQEYYHKNAGSALSPNEAAILSQAISTGDSWAHLKGFVNESSRKTQQEAINKINGMGDPYAALLYHASQAGSMFTPRLSVPGQAAPRFYPTPTGAPIRGKRE